MVTTDRPAQQTTRGFPIWAKLLVAIVILIVAIALAAPYFLDVNRYRDSIARALAKQTGRRITLGRITTHFFPGVGFVVENLHIGNPAGFAAGDLVTADEIRGNLALGPLLHREIHVNSLSLVRPKLNLVTAPGDINNYTFSSEPSASSANAPSTKEEAAMSLDQIDSIELKDAEVFLGNITGASISPSADANGINVTLHNFAVSPMRVHEWQASSNFSGVTLSLAGWSAPIAFRSGQVTLAGGKIDAQFVADLAKASDIKGTLSVPDVEHAQVNFEMSASELDVDKLIAAAGGSPSTPVAAEKKPEKPITPNELVARGHINIERVVSKPYTLGPANAEIRAYSDRAELWPISIGMYGGTLQLSSRVDRVTNPPRFTANAQVHNVDVAKLVDVTSSARGKIGGTGELELQVLGTLNDAWKKGLSGSGKFAVRNGHLPGVNLGSAAQSLGKLAGVGGDTPFTILDGDLSIENQRVASKQIHLDSPTGILDLRGNVGFDGSLAYQGQIVVNPATAFGGSSPVGAIVGGLLGSRVGKITVPIAVRGTIENPKVEPGQGIPNFAPPATANGAAPAATPPISCPFLRTPSIRCAICSKNTKTGRLPSPGRA